MHDSYFVKFDHVIQHNAKLDGPTRRALYSNIRQQIARNFEVANKRHSNPICRYCRVSAGTLKEYVAFVMLRETAEFLVDTSNSNDEIVVNSTERRSQSADSLPDKDTRKVAVGSHAKVESQSEEVHGKFEMKPSTLEKKKILRGSQVEEMESQNSTNSPPEQLAGKEDDGTEVSGSESVTQRKASEDVAGQQKSDALAMTATMLVGHNVEPNVESQSDEPECTREHAILMGDVPYEHEVNSSDFVAPVQDSVAESDDGLYSWQTDAVFRTISVPGAATCDLKDIEYTKLSNWLSLRIDESTTIHRFPMLYDLAVLGPARQDDAMQSVTWRLAEKFEPSLIKDSVSRRQDNVSISGDRQAVSDVVFIGPYDSRLVRQSELVRRRVRQVCDDILPRSSSRDVLCVTDVGCDVGLMHITDIVDISVLSAAATHQFDAYTALDSRCVSCVLLRFTPTTITV